MNTKRRCRQCRDYYPAEEFFRPGYHSKECLDKKLAASNNKSAGVPKRKSKRIHPDLQRAVRERDGGRCRWCGKPTTLQSHHVRYRSEGGPDDVANLLTLCDACHRLAHSSKVTYQPLLLTCLWLEYFYGQHLTVSQTQRWLDATHGDLAA